MIIIGEKLNSSIPSTLKALEAGDGEYIANLAKKQAECGANYLDINTAMCQNENEALVWAVKIATEASGLPIMVDSPNPQTIAHIFENTKLKNSIINSVTLDEEKLKTLIPIISKQNAGVVAMPICAGGMPKNAKERVENASQLIARLNEAGIENSRIYVDIIVEAAGAAWEAPKEALLAANTLRQKFSDVHLIAGLSNISFGLPGRKTINSAFLCCAMANGLDSAIMDAANKDLMLTLKSASAILGQDEYCMDYITAFRALSE